jgi:hypothetical protein
MSLWKKLKRLFGRREETNPFWNYERGSPRQSINLFIRPPDEQYFIERSGDLGYNGFSFQYEKKLATGAKITLRFQLPNASVAIEASGIVLEQDGQTVRGQFEEIQLEDQRLLARWLYESSIDDGDKSG